MPPEKEHKLDCPVSKGANANRCSCRREHCLCYYAIANWDGITHDRRCRYAASPEDDKLRNLLIEHGGYKAVSEIADQRADSLAASLRELLRHDAGCVLGGHVSEQHYVPDPKCCAYCRAASLLTRLNSQSETPTSASAAGDPE